MYGVIIGCQLDDENIMNCSTYLLHMVLNCNSFGNVPLPCYNAMYSLAELMDPSLAWPDRFLITT